MNQSRPPIVVILGHVDHGKTTLLDYLRKSNIAAREAGGITQSIRSFQHNNITFIDTPGHAAFSGMRARGSTLADIALLIISGTDGIMPQTNESIDFIKSSGIPFIVTITKSDLTGYDADKVKTQLTDMGVVVEDFGGIVPAVNVSAKTGAGIPELLASINSIASLAPPQADPEGPLELVILESRMDSKKGPLAAVVVKNGTLKVGDSLYQKDLIGKARAILTSDDESLKSAPPSLPVEILGLTAVPIIGSEIYGVPKDSFSTAEVSARPTVDTRLDIILRADVTGSLEAILASLSPEINILSSGTGDITENDVMSARTAKARIIAFNVRTPSGVAKLAEVEKVSIDDFKIIYELFESLDTLLHPAATETITGKASVAAQFKIGPDKIAGCKCIEGTIKKADTIRLLRGDVVVGQSRFKSLRSGKAEVESVKPGQEFGAVLGPFLDFKVGDSIIAFTKHG